MMNILIVGLGSIARKHITAINSLDDIFIIYALRSKESMMEEGIINVYNIEEVEDKIDFAIISNPTNLHYEFIRRLSTQGIPLFIEKPPVDTLNNIDSLIDIIENANIINYVACNLRFHPCIEYLKNYIAINHNKRINEVNVYCGSYLPSWRPTKNFREVYSANESMGGGVHLDLFHELDYTEWIFGKPLRASCIKRSVSSLKISSVDFASYNLEYDDFTVSITLNYYRKDAKRSIEILFEEETWTVDLINNTILNGQNEILYRVDDFQMSNTYKDQIKYFINCLRDNQKPMNTFAESIEILKTCLSND